jgi:hypothetical protein
MIRSWSHIIVRGAVVIGVALALLLSSGAPSDFHYNQPPAPTAQP